jgi:hypothetical protein
MMMTMTTSATKKGSGGSSKGKRNLPFLEVGGHCCSFRSGRARCDDGELRLADFSIMRAALPRTAPRVFARRTQAFQQETYPACHSRRPHCCCCRRRCTTQTATTLLAVSPAAATTTTVWTLAASRGNERRDAVGSLGVRIRSVCAALRRPFRRHSPL